VLREFGDLAPVMDSFASAAVDPTRWNAAMEVAAKATGSFGALLFPVRDRTPSMALSDSMRPALDSYVHEGWIQRDERCRSLPAFMRKGVSCEFDFTTPEEMARHPYYQEFLSPHGLRWFAGVKVGGGENVWALSLQRSAEQGPFSAGELERLAGLSCRLAGAAELASAFGFARMEAALAAFESSRTAVAMINRVGEVVRLNASAERLLGPDLQIARGHIVSCSSDATRALDRSLSEIVWSQHAVAFQPPVVLPRRNGPPIIAYPSRLASATFEAFAPCQGSIVFIDLEARLMLTAGDLRRVFNLTGAEERLADRLLREKSLKAAAESLGVATGTVRNQLKAIYQKTGTNGQGQLIALIASLARPRYAQARRARAAHDLPVSRESSNRARDALVLTTVLQAGRLSCRFGELGVGKTDAPDSA
jgi:DNA-binding CsgD family transcriptional regulator